MHRSLWRCWSRVAAARTICWHRDLENAARLAMRDLDGVKLICGFMAQRAMRPMLHSAATQAVATVPRSFSGPSMAKLQMLPALRLASAGVNVLSFSNNPTIAGGNVLFLGRPLTTQPTGSLAMRNAVARTVSSSLHGQDVAGQLGRNAIQKAIAANGATLAGTLIMR